MAKKKVKAKVAAPANRPRGRPKHPLTGVGEMDFAAPPGFERLRITDRAAVDEYSRRTLEDLSEHYRLQKTGCRTLVETLQQSIQAQAVKGAIDLATMRQLESQQQKWRQACNDELALVGLMIRQYELMADLDKPAEEDPRYTPVQLVLAMDVPASAMVPQPFEPPAEDVDPGIGRA